VVLGQRPRAGQVEERGALIILDLSLGRRQTRVPDVVGQSERDARATLEREGFTVAEAVAERSDLPRGQVLATMGSGASGNVVQQDPAGGSRARAGTAVRLTVAP
jgi:serine/threonine-protein kinase